MWSNLASQMLLHDNLWRVLEELCDKNMPGKSINLPVKLLFQNIIRDKTTQNTVTNCTLSKTKFL